MTISPLLSTYERLRAVPPDALAAALDRVTPVWNARHRTERDRDHLVWRALAESLEAVVDGHGVGHGVDAGADPSTRPPRWLGVLARRVGS